MNATSDPIVDEKVAQSSDEDLEGQGSENGMHKLQSSSDIRIQIPDQCIKTDFEGLSGEDCSHSDSFVIHMDNHDSPETQKWSFQLDELSQVIPESSKSQGNGCPPETKHCSDKVSLNNCFHESSIWDLNTNIGNRKELGLQTDLSRASNTYFEIPKSASDTYPNMDSFLSKQSPYYLQYDSSNYFRRMPAPSFLVYPVTQKLAELRKTNDKLRQQLGPAPVQEGRRKSTVSIQSKKRASNKSITSTASKAVTKAQSNADGGRNNAVDKPATANNDTPTVDRPSRTSNKITPSKTKLSVPSNINFPKPSTRPTVNRKHSEYRQIMGTGKPSSTPVHSIKPQFLANVQPVGGKPKTALFGGHNKQFGAIQKKSSPIHPALQPTFTEQPEVNSGDTEKEVTEDSIEIAPKQETKCDMLKNWFRAKQHCCATPFRSCYERIIGSEKITCFFFTVMIAIFVVVCLLLIIFPIAEYFYNRR